MPLTTAQLAVILVLIAAATFLTRALPFALFPENKEQPEIVSYLGTVIPPAMMGLLVIYCFRNISVSAWPYGLPELIASISAVALQLWKKNVLISIGAGTIIYMILVQFVFAAV